MDFSYEDDDDPGANQEELLRNIHAEFRGDFPDEPAGEDPENEAHDGDSSDDGLVLLSALPRRTVLPGGAEAFLLPTVGRAEPAAALVGHPWPQQQQPHQPTSAPSHAASPFRPPQPPAPPAAAQPLAPVAVGAPAATLPQVVGPSDGGDGGGDGDSDTDELDPQYNDTQCFYCDDGGDGLLLCDGVCRRSLHWFCLGYTEDEYRELCNQKGAWYCPECELGEHACFQCRSIQKVVKGQSEETAQCSQYGCPHFFHPSCVGKTKEEMDTYRCPSHACKTCGEIEDPSDPNRRLIPCRICTVAFHVECVPMKYAKEDEESRKKGQAQLVRMWLPPELGGPKKVDEEGNVSGEIDTPLMYCHKHNRRLPTPGAASGGLSQNWWADINLWHPLDDKDRGNHIFRPPLLHRAAHKAAQRLRQPVKCVCFGTSCVARRSLAFPPGMEPQEERRPAPVPKLRQTAASPAKKPPPSSAAEKASSKLKQQPKDAEKGKGKAEQRRRVIDDDDDSNPLKPRSAPSGSKRPASAYDDDESDSDAPLAKRLKGITAPKPKIPKPSKPASAAAPRPAAAAVRPAGAGAAQQAARRPAESPPPAAVAARPAAGRDAEQHARLATVAVNQRQLEVARKKNELIFDAVRKQITRDTVQASLTDNHRFFGGSQQKRPLTVDGARLRSMGKTIDQAQRLMLDDSQSVPGRQLGVKSMIALAGAGANGKNIIQELGMFHRTLRTRLKTWLYGHRYTAHGRHFTNSNKLKDIVERLQPYMLPGDCVVDSSCGKNEWLLLMLDAAERGGKEGCTGASFDIVPPPNTTNVQVKDWFKVSSADLPPNATPDSLVIGLNPPFGINNADAERFMLHASRFRPRMLAFIVPQSTRLPKGYRVLVNDIDLLKGYSFYLPNSFDTDRRTRVMDWNRTPPAFYVLVREDWVYRWPYPGEMPGAAGGGMQVQPMAAAWAQQAGPYAPMGMALGGHWQGDWECAVCGAMGNEGQLCASCKAPRSGQAGPARTWSSGGAALATRMFGAGEGMMDIDSLN